MKRKDDCCDMYRPNGEVQGDSRSIPDAGVTTGVTDTYGADLSGDAINRIGGIGRAAKSDGDQGPYEHGA